MINGNTCSRKVYESFLLKNRINFTASNYAMWQGEAEKLILKDPHSLTHHFENLCGSAMFKREYDNIKSQLDEVGKAVDEKSSKLNKLRRDKKNIKSLRHTSE